MAELDDTRGARLEVQPGADADGQPVIALSGELDISSVEKLRRAVEQAAASAPQRLTFDVASLRFMDSAGVAVLLNAAREVPSVRLRAPTRAVRRVVELTGLSDVLVMELSSSTTQTFACRPAAVSDARRLVRTTLDGRDAELIEAAELLISELASNCVRHAQTGFEVRICDADEVRIEVRDMGGGSPRVLAPSADQPSGRGLLIVEAVSERWGVESEPPLGKVVWFTLS